jgi:hypothetical protein
VDTDIRRVLEGGQKSREGFVTRRPTLMQTLVDDDKITTVNSDLILFEGSHKCKG